MRLLSKLADIWRHEELRNKIGITLGLILVYRIGSFIVIPGVNSDVLADQMNSLGSGGLGDILSLFTGGAFTRASIFALGIMPYISASIIVQLMSIAVPAVQKLQAEGESGRKKITQGTRFLTIAISLVQAPGYLASTVASVPGAVVNPSTFWWFSAVMIIVSSTLVIMWLGERITDKGVGNGISLLIMIGIIAALPQAFAFEFVTKINSSGGGLAMLVIELVLILAVILLCILLVQGTRRIPIAYPKQMMGQRFAGARQYIPLKINAAGVMPIIFAQAIMFIPITFAGFSTSTAASGFVQEFSDFSGFWYNFVFAVLVIVFTYFYTAITVNPDQMAADMKRSGATIYNLKQGKPTAKFLNETMTRIVLPGSFFLAFVAILPAFAMRAGVNPQFAQFYGGTSLLIMVGVVLDTVQQINAHLLNRHYDGLMKRGRRTRSGM